MTERQLVTDADAELMAHATESCVDWTQRLLATRAACEEGFEKIAALTEGLEGLTAQRMMMEGVSPIRLLEQGRDIARALLAELHGTENG